MQVDSTLCRRGRIFSIVVLACIRIPGDYREALRIIAEQLFRLKRIVHDMFPVARSDSGALQPVRKPFYLDQLIDEAVHAARVIAEPRGVTVSTEVAPEAMFIGDEDLMRQLLTNLLDNAVRYTSHGGFIAVRCTAEHGTYRIQVWTPDPVFRQPTSRSSLIGFTTAAEIPEGTTAAT